MARGKTEREKQIETEIVDLARIATLAEKNARTADATKAIERIGRLRVEAVRLKAIRVAEGQSDPVERLRGLSRIAASEGSWGPAGELASKAGEIEIERVRVAALASAAEMTDLSADDLLAVILDALPHLPREAIDAIGAVCTHRDSTFSDDDDVN